MDRKIIQQLGRSLDWRKRYETLFRQVFSAGGSAAGGLAFDAFISYSHAADGQLAAALQKGLHRFAKPLFKLRAVRAFRDETTLAMTPKLWPEIEKALRASRFFILMADPRSAQSEWVQKEVACWLDVKGANQILIVWTGGELVWDKLKKDFDWDRTTAVPRLLIGAFDGEEPLYLDLRWARTEVQLSRKHPKFAHAIAKLSASIRGRSLDEIFGDDVREQRRTARFLFGIVVILLFLTLFALWQWRSAIVAERNTRDVASQANLSAARNLARNPEKGSNGAQALAYLAQALHLNTKNHKAVALTSALLTQNGWGVLLDSMRHGAAVTFAQFSPDGRRVVTASADGTAQLWELDRDTKKAVGKPMKHRALVSSARFSPDGWQVVTASADRTACLWEVPSGKLIGKPMQHDGEVTSVQFSPDGRQVVTASADGTARLWDALSGRPAGEPMRHGEPVTSAQFSPDGQLLVTASQDGTVRLWSAATGKPVSPPLRHPSPVWSAQFSPGGQRIVTASDDGLARLWDFTSGQPIGEPKLMRHGKAVSSAEFSPDGERVVTASWDGTACLWDATTGQPISKPMRHEEAVMSAQFSPDGQRVVTASGDGTARLWDVMTGQAIGEPVPHRGWVHSAQFSPDGQKVVTASNDSTASLWEAVNRKAICEPMRYEKPVDSAQFSSDSRQVMTASGDGTARLWDATTGRVIDRPIGRAGPVPPAPFRSPDGQRPITISPDHHWLAATGGADGSAQLWDLTVRDPAAGPFLLKVDRRKIQVLACSPDSHWLVTCSDDDTMRLWDLTAKNPADHPVAQRYCGSVTAASISLDNCWFVSGDKYGAVYKWELTAKGLKDYPPVLLGHGRPIAAAAISRDNRWLITGDGSGTARLWSAETGQAIGEPMRHEQDQTVNSVQFSPDGQRAVTASDDGIVRLWDAATGQPLGPPLLHGVPVISAQFSPDSQRLVTVSKDGAARLWDVPTVSGEHSPDPEDLMLLSGLAEATGLQHLETAGQVEILNPVPPESVRAIREKVAGRFAAPRSNLTPLQRCLKWSVSERTDRTVSPLSELTVAEWEEDRIRHGSIDGLRSAIQVDPVNPRLAAHLGRRLADAALDKSTLPDSARRARAEADFQTRRALKLAPENDEVKKLRAEVVQALQLRQ